MGSGVRAIFITAWLGLVVGGDGGGTGRAQSTAKKAPVAAAEASNASATGVAEAAAGPSKAGQAATEAAEAAGSRGKPEARAVGGAVEVGNSTGLPGISAAEAGQVLPPPPGFDVAGRSRDVLAHLSAVIRFYRASLTPIQTVGQPSDLLYREQAVSQAERTGELAFQSARAEALLLTTYAKRAGLVPEKNEGETQRLQTMRATIAQQLADLKTQEKALDAQTAKARGSQMPALEQQREQVEGAIELNTAMSDALGRILGMSDTRGQTGLSGDIERLGRSAPELGAAKLNPVVTPPLQTLNGENTAGVSSQAQQLFALLRTEHAIDAWMQDEGALHTQAQALRTPLTNILRSTVQQGQALSQQTQTALVSGSATSKPDAPTPKNVGGKSASAASMAAANAKTLEDTKKSFAAVTSTFNVLSAAAVPLSQEIITLEQTRANLLAWRTAVHDEYRTVLRYLLTRVCLIALALAVLWGAGEVWRRATTRYVRDVRRRRQLLVMRRLVIGFLSGLVVIFGFVTQFNSLATFAGFITAGLAVGLQTILLSVAAYFFIVGRFGVKVGDRITIATVTGDVIEVGLVRFYLMELAGSGTELRPTGRVAVFSNSVLFQAGTPLYKQMPGTEYAWHELTMKLAAGADYRKAVSSVSGAVTKIYEGYKAKIEQQHRDLESWMDASVDTPSVECRIQLVDGGVQLNIRFPVEIQEAAQVDERVTEQLLALMRDDAEVKAAVSSGPEIKAAVKG